MTNGTGMGWGGQRHALAALYPRERPGTHCTGDQRKYVADNKSRIVIYKVSPGCHSSIQVGVLVAWHWRHIVNWTLLTQYIILLTFWKIHSIVDLHWHVFYVLPETLHIRLLSHKEDDIVCQVAFARPCTW